MADVELDTPKFGRQASLVRRENGLSDIENQAIQGDLTIKTYSDSDLPEVSNAIQCMLPIEYMGHQLHISELLNGVAFVFAAVLGASFVFRFDLGINSGVIAIFGLIHSLCTFGYVWNYKNVKALGSYANLLKRVEEQAERWVFFLNSTLITLITLMTYALIIM